LPTIAGSFLVILRCLRIRITYRV